MEKFEALEKIKRIWEDDNISLANKVVDISDVFYDVGLNLPATAAFIKATPAEFSSFLSLGELDEDILEMVSSCNLPKTTWSLINNANNDEIIHAINTLNGNDKSINQYNGSYNEKFYYSLLEVAKPTKERMISNLTGGEIEQIRNKAIGFNVLNDWEKRFMKSIIVQKKSGKTLTNKQAEKLLSTIEKIVENKVIVRNSIDGDQDLCDKVLDAIEK